MGSNSSSGSIRRLYEVAANRNVGDGMRYAAEMQLFVLASSDSEEALKYLQDLSLDAARGALNGYLKKRYILAFSDVEDFASQGFERAWEKRAKFRGDGKFSSYAAGCAVNALISAHRRNIGPTTVSAAFACAVRELNKHNPGLGECIVRRYLGKKTERKLKAIAKGMKVTEAKIIDLLTQGWTWILQDSSFRNVLIDDPDGCVRTFIRGQEGRSIQAFTLVVFEDKGKSEVASTLRCAPWEVSAFLCEACDRLLQEHAFWHTTRICIDSSPDVVERVPHHSSAEDPGELASLIDRLNDPYKTVLKLFYVHELHESEVLEILNSWEWNTIIGSVRRWKYVGLQKIGRLLRNDRNDDRGSGTTVRLFIRPENHVSVEAAAVIVLVRITGGPRVLPPVEFNMTLDSNIRGGAVNERIYLPAGTDRCIAAEVFSKDDLGPIQGTLRPSDPNGESEIFCSPLYGKLKIDLPARQDVDAVVQVAPHLHVGRKGPSSSIISLHMKGYDDEADQAS